MNRRFAFLGFILAAILTLALSQPAPVAQADDPNPPTEPVKLIFIHHSTGENWLTDGYGDLGRTLAQNNYFVSDTNYGWGPDAIGDRTDIPNWPEWFRSDQTPVYMKALFAESGQNSNYTRTFSDPGGENQVIMFKSCFPNSALEGSPNDPPDAHGELTVGHAKYVYNEILKYFATRPDKLFVVITAPPLQDITYAKNARAFNEWLLKDWLRENNYTQPNVVVFDFYTVLTGPDHHHRYANGQIERVFQPGKNTSAYPSAPDDDHPSVAGSRKATDEFIPLLNIFYHRWKAIAQTSAPTTVNPTAASEPTQPLALTRVLDDFESDVSDWESFTDEMGATTMACVSDTGQTHSGAQSMRLDFKIAASGWATCARIYPSVQDWSGSPGISFYLHSAKAGQVLHVDLYAQNGEERESYVYSTETSAESVSGWAPVQVRWEDFHRVDWEANAGAPFGKPDQVAGMAFGIPSADSASEGQFWVDDLLLTGAAQPPVVEPTTTTAAVLPASTELPVPTVTQSTPAKPQPGAPNCGGSAALPLAIFGSLWVLSRKRK
jgi:hypothetical protein